MTRRCLVRLRVGEDVASIGGMLFGSAGVVLPGEALVGFWGLNGSSRAAMECVEPLSCGMSGSTAEAGSQRGFSGGGEILSSR
jgi:hypothetical protein